MEVLKEIVHTLTRYQVRQVDVITNPEIKPSKKENRYWEAYVGLREHRWKDDEAFASHFGLEHPSKNYNRFKNELKERLLNTLLFTEGSGRDFNDNVSKYQEVLLKWSVAEMLRLRGAYQAFWELAGSCLATAQEYEFLKMIIDICGLMKTHCIGNPALRKEYLRLNAIYQEYWPLYQAEEQLRNAYEGFISELALSKGYKKDFAPLAARIVLDYKEEAAHNTTIQFHFYYRIIQFYAKALYHDWQGGLDVADQALTFFNKKQNPKPVHLMAFGHQKASCLLMLGRYNDARAVLNEALSYTTTDSMHHFKNRELATVNALYAERYEEAWEMCKMALKHERFSKIPLIDQESWRIYHGYLNFMAQVKLLDISAREKGELPKFRLSAWLNDLPLYTRDKRGAQIPVLILQTLWLFYEQRWDELDCRIEALRKFRQRNLNADEEHFRTNCFIHMLELLPKYAHDLETLPKAAAPWLKKLQSGHLDILDRTFEIEVVPYERQWAWVLQMAGATQKTIASQQLLWHKVSS